MPVPNPRGRQARFSTRENLAWRRRFPSPFSYFVPVVLLMIAVVAGVAALIAPAGESSSQFGRARVIDGDTIEVQATRIRLHGIDAPELDQPCLMDARQWRCGREAARALEEMIGTGTVTCEVLDRDRYGRSIAVCRAGGEDLGAWMVLRGWALAYRHYATDYVSEEAAAKAARRGIWRGTFMPPWEWRRQAQSGNRQDAPRARPGPCRIKGNISKSGERIYHVPGGRYYDATRIDPGRGERWFCTEAEARAAGWRRSRR